MATKEEFIGEAIVPDALAAPVKSVAPGEPALPERFTWRGKTYEVAAVVSKWKETGPCTHGSGERYVRKHWFEIRTSDGTAMKIYFERRARSARERTKRWWLFSIVKK